MQFAQLSCSFLSCFQSKKAVSKRNKPLKAHRSRPALHIVEERKVSNIASNIMDQFIAKAGDGPLRNCCAQTNNCNKKAVLSWFPVLMLMSSLFLSSRYRLCLFRDRVSSEHLLHRDPGLGTLLPVPVLSAGASLGQMQAALEHGELRRGHGPQEQDNVAGSQHHQLYLPCHWVLGVSCHTHTRTVAQVNTHNSYKRHCLLLLDFFFAVLFMFCAALKGLSLVVGLNWLWN